MADRFKFAGVRQKVIEMMKTDLLGPMDANEVLNQNPRYEYLVGMLAPQTDEGSEQELEGDASFESDADYTAGEEDDNEPISSNRFKTLPLSVSASISRQLPQILWWISAGAIIISLPIRLPIKKVKSEV